jgi:hypothetical protein
MNTRDDVLTVNNGDTELRDTINDFGLRHRIVGPIVLLVALMLGTAQWAHSPGDAAAVEPGQQQSTVNNTAAPFEYFPAAFVNQAQQYEDHIQAF